MSSILQMIRKPLVTEKSEGMKDENVYTFAVAKAANKGQIAAAVVEAFKVEVTAVRTLVVRGKNRRRGGHQWSHGNMEESVRNHRGRARNRSPRREGRFF